MRRLFSLYILLLITVVALAQSVQVNGPSAVSAGENFRMEYTVSSSEVSDVHLSGKVPEGLEEVAGPYVSTQSSYQIVNGHASSSSSARVTYIFYAAKSGSYTIPAVSLSVNGKRLSSRSHQVKVSGGSGNVQQPQSAPHMHQQPDNSKSDVKSLPAGGGDVFIKVSADKMTVVEQEPVRLAYKLYTASQITVPSDLKMPNVQDFTIHEIQQPSRAEWHTENVGGKTYRCATWKQYIVYPQSTGKLTVPGSSVQINRVVRHHNIDPIEQMFNPGATYHEEEMNIAVPSLTINVTELPNRPDNFSGGVGTFSMTSSLSKREVKAGEPVTVTVRISGQGNLKLLKQPTVKFPKDFEVYDPKVTDNTRNTGNGVEGSMTYEFIAVPQNKGNFTIPPVEFIYYDTHTSGYKTLKGEKMALNVLEGDASMTDASYQEELHRSDIYSIKPVNEISYRNTDTFFLSSVYIILLLLFVLTFFVLLYIFRKRAIERADIVKMKANNANKVATKRLNKAAMLMKSHKKDEFYDEVLRALWGYAADKVNIAVEELSKDNIQEKLIGRGCNTFSVDKFTAAIEECEFARYAPSQDVNSSMTNTYDMAVTAIMEIEEALNYVKSNSGKVISKTLLLVFLFTIHYGLSLNAATTIETANAAYQSGNYQQAITLYQQALKAGHSAQLYYNLGNAYYRTNQITEALICYERAHIYDPTDAQIKHNLDLVRTKTKDKLIPAESFFITTWYNHLLHLTSIYGWALLSLLFIAISLLCLLGYLFTAYVWQRKLCFWSMLLTFLLFIFSVFFALQQRLSLLNNSCAIVTAHEVLLKKQPENNAATVATIHEGTHLEILDDGMRDWTEVQLPDGKTGWLSPTTYQTLVE